MANNKMKKYQEFNVPKKIEEGQLRVWHIPQVPMHCFYVYVRNIKEAQLILNTLAYYDLFQLEYKIKPDYSNVNGLEIYEKGEWCEWENEDGENISDIDIDYDR